MRAFHLTHIFPKLSETFIEAQMSALRRLGIDIRVLFSTAGTDPLAQPLLRQWEDNAVHLGRLQSGRSQLLGTLAAMLAQPRTALHVHAQLLRIPSQSRAAGQYLSDFTDGLLLAGLPPPDLLHCQFINLAPRALRWRRAGFLQAPIVAAVRGHDITAGASRLDLPTLFAQVDRFLPVCHAFARRLASLGCPPDKITVLHSGIELDRHPVVQRQVWDGRRPLRLISIGRLVPKKGFAPAIDEIARWRAAAGTPFVYTIAGDGPERTIIEERINAHGLADSIRLVGALTHEEVAQELQRADLFLAPCRRGPDGDEEGIPNTLKEAMATQLPVIASHHSGIPELVEDGVSGLLTPEDGGLAEALASLCSAPERWPAMGAHGRRRAAEHFDLHKTTQQLSAIYRELVPLGPAPLALR